MDLNKHQGFSQLDQSGMLAHIDQLPGQLEQAWSLGLSQPLPKWQGINHVVIAGVGGSAIGADLLAEYASLNSRVPVVIHRAYGLPDWARGDNTLVIASSHSGNTEETLSAFEQALENGCRLLAVTRGGLLAEKAQNNAVPVWLFQHEGQPRAAVAFSFGLLIAALARLHLLPDIAAIGEELTSAVEAMRLQQPSLAAETPLSRNPAKRLAGQCVDRWITIFGSAPLTAVARRWKCQVNEVAKAWAQFEFIPEADHNTLAGIYHPQNELCHAMMLFLQAPSYHPRDILRTDLTRKALMIEGINTDAIEARGDTPLAHIWTSLHFGDYFAYYLAMAYDVDPTPITAIEAFKREMETPLSGS